MAPENECSEGENDDHDDEGTRTSSHHQSATTMDDTTLVFDEITDALHVTIQDGDMSVWTDERTLTTDEGTVKSKEYGVNGNVVSDIRAKKKLSRKKTRVGRRLKGMRSMVRTADEEEERMKRFEDAYALMCSVAVGKESNDNHTQNPNEVKPIKRWSRASHIPVAVSIDGRVYDDLQRSPAFKHVPTSKRYGPEVVGAELNGSQLTDRGASWMVHLPTKHDRRSSKFFGQNYADVGSPPGTAEDHPQEVISPSQMKLLEIVDRLQGHHHRNSGSSPSRSSVKKPPQAMETGKRTGVDTEKDLSLEEKTHDEEESPSKQTQEKDHYRMFKPNNLFVSSAVEKIKQQKILTPFKVGVNVKNIRNRFLGIKEEEEEEEEEYGDVICEDMDNNFGAQEPLRNSNDPHLLSQPMFEAKKIQKVVAAQVKSGQSVIDTDNQSQISEGMDALQRARIGSLMLSPTILTKRLNQAISAIEMCNWDQVNYLISANPWLAEMTDVNSGQFLLHKLAFHGGGTVSVEDGIGEKAPSDLNEELIHASMTSIHKFDINGNLPLHMAAEAGNEEMVNRLSEIFPGGASVRNKDGLLPLHLSVLACDNPLVNTPLRILSKILALFPAALAIADNDGNLPLHLATAYLAGDIGAHVIHMLVDEGEKQGDALRFPSDIITLANIDDSASNFGADFEESNDVDDVKSILFVKNSLGWNPLITAIHRGGGWEILDALLSRDGIEHIAYEKDGYGRNILQLTIAQEPCDPPSILSILKGVPGLVAMRDADGALPIETACLRNLQSEVIMAIVLLDLPIDLDGDENIIRDGFGGSWWYLNCDCDDMFVHIIREILEICDYQQKRALCFTKNSNGNSLISRASPKCKQELRKTLRFDERYEFVGSAIHSNEEGVKIFEALDFGTDEEPLEEGRKVTIKYYGNEHTYNHATRILRKINLVDTLFAEMRFFEASTTESHPNNIIQRCIAIETPILTLRTIVSSMAKKNYRSDQKRLDRYLSKTRKVFRMIGESISYLHDHGVIHGHLVLECCGKFDDGWKLIDLSGAHNVGESMSLSHIGVSAPPETVMFSNGHSRGRGRPTLREEITASPSLDIWAFGKLMYEVLVGKDILPFDPKTNVGSDERYLHSLGNWNEESLTNVVEDIEASGEGALVADLISHCLCPQPEYRPKSMQEVLSHAYWNTTSSHRRNNSAMRHGGGGISRRYQS